jgi:hypothetical protein
MPRVPEDTFKSHTLGLDLRTPAGRLEYLEKILPTVPAKDKTKIVEVIGEVAQSMGGGAGPPDPLTDEERVARVREVLLAVGENIANRAWPWEHQEEVIVLPETIDLSDPSDIQPESNWVAVEHAELPDPRLVPSIDFLPDGHTVEHTEADPVEASSPEVQSLIDASNEKARKRQALWNEDSSGV